MNIVCPSCGASGSADKALTGREVNCPKCGEKFIAEGKDIPLFQEISQKEPVTAKEGMENAEEIALPVPELTVSEILKDSWKLSKNKRFALVCRVGVLLLVGAMAALTLIIDSEDGLVMAALRMLNMPEVLLSLAGAVLTLISMGLSGNAEAGLPYLGVRHSAGARVGLKTCFRGFSRTYFKQVFLAGIMKTILTVLGFLFLIFPGIYLTFAYGLALPLIIDRGFGAWQALELSRRAITRVWFQVFGAYFVMTVVPFILPASLFGARLMRLLQKIDEQNATSLSLRQLYEMFPGDFQIVAILALCLVVLWFFLLPWFFAGYGVLYHKLFTPKADNDMQEDKR